MSAVLAFAHQGVPCAIPASQARAVDVRVPPEAQASLWHVDAAGRRAGSTRPVQRVAHARAIEARTEEGTVWVGCADPRLVELPEGAALALPPLLRRILGGLPHVVGLSMLDGRHTWLVDLTRYRSNGSRGASTTLRRSPDGIASGR